VLSLHGALTGKGFCEELQENLATRDRRAKNISKRLFLKVKMLCPGQVRAIRA